MILSIITINYNNAEGLRKTIESVYSQTFTDFEYIIVDGGSTDGSVDVIENLTTNSEWLKAHPLKWVSEPDKGIYNAMNKGIRMAKGEYLQFLNSGDYLLDENVLSNVFSQNLVEDIIYGERIDVKDNELMHRRYSTMLTFSFFVQSALSHQASFFKRDCFETYGLYAEQYKYASDWLLYMDWIFHHQCSYQHISIPVVYYDCTGISSQEDSFPEMHAERRAILEKEFPELYAEAQELISLRWTLRQVDRRAEKFGKVILYPIRKVRKLFKKK